MAMNEEDSKKLAQIEDSGGKNLTPAQKAVMVKFATIDIKGKKPPQDMTIPPLEKSGGGSSAFDPKPMPVTAKDRE